MAKTKTIPPSASGYYRVKLARSFPHMGFTYRPGTGVTVDRALLDVMMAEAELVDHVASAD